MTPRAQELARHALVLAGMDDSHREMCSQCWCRERCPEGAALTHAALAVQIEADVEARIAEQLAAADAVLAESRRMHA